MKATIWHNPNCGTSRTVLARLQGRDDVELEADRPGIDGELGHAGA